MSNVIKMENIHKTYNNKIKALQGANLSLKKGEVLSLVGENAAGKTTLMNVLYGLVQKDKGKIYIKNEKKEINHPEDAIKWGIGMVPQHFEIISDFNVLENIILGREEPFLGKLWRLQYDKAQKEINQIMDNIDVNIDLRKKAGELSIGIQQKLEIIKVLFKGAEIIILDEPTTVLAPNEIEEFLSFIENLKRQGNSIIFISHRLKEIFKISDRITILREGRTAKTVNTDQSSMEEVSKIMIGREVNNRDDKIIIKKPLSDKSILSVKNISVIDGVNNLYDLSLDLKEGELLGIAGVEGNGQREIGEAIIGLKEVSEGIISLEGEKINHLTSSERRFKGIRYVPEDRIKKGLALNATINENIIMGYHRNKFLKDSKFTIDWDKTFSFSKNIIDSFRVEGSNDPADPVESLSGGNMQKLIIGREFVREAKLLVLSQPTVGLDFSAKDYIYRKINELKEKGSSILLISENLDELMKLSNRILVIYRGKIIKEFRVEDNYNEKEIGLYMTGAKGNGE